MVRREQQPQQEKEQDDSDEPQPSTSKATAATRGKGKPKAKKNNNNKNDEPDQIPQSLPPLLVPQHIQRHMIDANLMVFMATIRVKCSN